MRYFIKIAIVAILVLMPMQAPGQFYFGAGPSLKVPVEKFADANDISPGITILLESRRFCNLWMGLRADYFFLDSLDGAENYYEQAFYFSPELRYVFTSGDICTAGSIQPYIQAMLTVSAIGGTDRKNRLGMGLGAGAGIAMPFVWLKHCWAVDINALYLAPNFIFKDDERPALNSFTIGLGISVSL